MKVSDLFETDWDNQQETFRYLYKKQKAAVEQFRYELFKLLKKHPEQQSINFSSEPTLNDWVKSDRLNPDGWTNATASWWRDVRSNVQIFQKFPTLNFEVGSIIDAKSKFEKAGGIYKNNNR